MTITRFSSVAALAVELAFSGCARPATVASTSEATRPAEVVLRFAADAPVATREALAQRYGARREPAAVSQSEHWILPPSTDTAQVLGSLRADPAVRYALPNYIRHVAGFSAPEYSSSTQWNLAQINAPQAWQTYFSNDHPPGQGVVVAVLDTGIDVRHPDLAANIAKDQAGNPRFIDEHPKPSAPVFGNPSVDRDTLGRVFEWSSAYQDDLHPGPDGHGHGTHVAGIVAACASDSGYGGTNVVGVAPGASILPVKIMACDGSGDDNTIANGIVDAADQGARIENLSIGGDQPSDYLEDALAYARSKGVLIVIAAGNGGGSVYYPAAYPGMVAVGAVDAHDIYQSYSNYGPQVAVVAPGGTTNERTEGVLSTLPTYTLDPAVGYNYGTLASAALPSGGYGRVSGTSQATPHVSGVAALIWSLNPQLGVDQVRDRLVASAKPLGTGFSVQTGWGRLDALAALTIGDASFGR